jgi:2-polyprenyl-3-methyl-5-hydroxy-6-metoxy-1,4-benzoquinol methylase
LSREVLGHIADQELAPKPDRRERNCDIALTALPSPGSRVTNEARGSAGGVKRKGKQMAFTSHNIRLSDGTETYPAAGRLLEEDFRFRAACRMLNFAFQDGLSGKRIADLGCLEGGYATGFARLGMAVVGLEVRESNFQNCLYVKSKVNLPNLIFFKDDANNIGKYGTFDAIWVCGILYHLENPRSFLTNVSRVCRRIILIETHFTHANWTPAAERHKLSKICEHDGLRGRWIHEYDDGISQDELDNLKWASWSNHRSFWVEKEHLLQLIKDVGFDIVLEQYDLFPDILDGMENYYRGEDRALFVGIKSP